ncbi:MAG TPA: hypothetical protein DCY94_02825 [Firmicutes bacterium]|nr:hypothetical protein [Bacillota bacterium]
MGNIGTMVKRFLSNKNTVTLLAIIVCTVVLYAFYNWRVKSAVSTTYVCYATEVIPARTQITNDMVSNTKILTSQKTTNMIQDCSQVVGKYVSYATEIPQNSYFYQTQLLTGEEMPDSAFDDIPDGYGIYNMKVTFDSTYGNSVFPGNMIDLYLKTTDTTSNLLVYGKFIQSIKVLGVKDNDGKNVFETTVETRTPAQLLFAVPEDLFLLLRKAEYLGLQIDIVPRNDNYTAANGATLVSSAWLKQLILDQTAEIPDECLTQETGIAECRLADDINNGDNQNQGGTTTPPAGDNQDNQGTTPTE